MSAKVKCPNCEKINQFKDDKMWSQYDIECSDCGKLFLASLKGESMAQVRASGRSQKSIKMSKIRTKRNTKAQLKVRVKNIPVDLTA